MNPVLLTKAGAITSVAGISLFILFAGALLIFPVSKQCTSTANCKYVPQSPPYFQSILSPGFLAVSLMIIAIGILAVRLGRRTLPNKTPADSRDASR